MAFSKTLSNWKVEIINSFCTSKAEYNVSKDTGEITVEQKRINNALMENRNAIIKLVTKAANGYRNWERFRNRCMLVLEKVLILKSTRMTEALKWLKNGPRQLNVV